MVFTVAARIFSYEPTDREFLPGFNEVNQLPVRMGLERGKGSQEINSLEQGGFPLGIASRKQDNPPGNVQVQAGETSEVGQG
jgi:hypothetical protein